MEDCKAIQRCVLFSGLAASVQEHLLEQGCGENYCRGQMLLAPQQRLDRLGIVVRGRIHQLHISVEGEYQLFAVVEPFQLLGDDLICTRTQLAPYHMMAADDARVFWLPAEVLLRPGWIDEGARQTVLQRLLWVISDSNMKKEYRLAILAQRGLRERVLTYLTMQAEKRQNATVTIPFSREELASFLGVNRSALSHELSRMAADGLIEFHKNVFTLLSWQKKEDAHD